MFKIAITGPESSGKSTLSIQLAQALGCTYVPEFARYYLQEKQIAYTQADLNEIIDKQIEWLDDAAAQNNTQFLIADTDLLVLQIWEEVRFKSCSLALHEAQQRFHFDLILLCYPDIPWEADPLRESKDELDQLYERYHEASFASPSKCILIKGADRLGQALEAVTKKRATNGDPF